MQMVPCAARGVGVSVAINRLEYQFASALVRVSY